jgi:hypothetical protein
MVLETTVYETYESSSLLNEGTKNRQGCKCALNLSTCLDKFASLLRCFSRFRQSRSQYFPNAKVERSFSSKF